MTKTAIVTGVTGQDGSYLSELLLRKGYNVVGICRRSSVDTTSRIRAVCDDPKFELVEGDVTDPSNVNYWFHTYQPDEFYNLAAQSHVGTSFKQPSLTFKVNAQGVLNILEGIRFYSPKTRFYQASTSEMFGKNCSESYSISPLLGDMSKVTSYYQDESTPFSPQSPYSVAKAAAHHSVQLYRRAYDLHASCGILFNHESERRGEEFVTRKITKWMGEAMAWHEQHPAIFEGICQIHLYENMDPDYLYQGLAESPRFPKLRLGNLEPRRDWGHAEDYVEAMYLMLQQDEPDDYVIGTGETHSVEDFLREAFAVLGVENYKSYYVQDPKFMRPAEVDYLLADASKAKEKLGWEPKVTFKELVSRMVKYDKEKAKAESIQTQI